MVEKEKGKKEKKRKPREKAEKEEEEGEKEDREELEEILSKLRLRRIKEPIKELSPRRAVRGGLPKNFPNPYSLPRYQPEPKPRLNQNQKPENYGRRDSGWSEPERRKIEKIIVKEAEPEQLIKALEKNPKVFDGLSEKIVQKMREEFNKELEANVKDYEKMEKEGEKGEEEKSIEGKREVELTSDQELDEEFEKRNSELEEKEYLANEAEKRIAEASKRDSKDESEVDESIEDGRKEIVEGLEITLHEGEKFEPGEVLEKSDEEEGMTFPLDKLEVDAREWEIKQDNPLEMEVLKEVPEVIEPAEPQPSILTRLENQDLSILEIELLQPELEVEPRVEETEPEPEAQGY